MIRVNLLPVEYRKAEGPPLARVAVVVAGAILVTSALGGWGYVHFGVLAEAESRRDQLQQDLEQLRQQAERSKSLLREYTEYQRRRDTIEKIGSSRILWSRKLDEFGDIIHNKGDQKDYLVWLSSVRTSAGRGADSPVGLQFQGLCAGSLSNLSDFNKRIKDTKEFFEDFNRISPPAGTQKTFGDGKFPAVGWDFSFELDHKPANWREKQGETKPAQK